MKMRNYTPFPNLRFYGADSQDQDLIVVLVKATYLVRNGRLVVADEQARVLLEDVYHGEPNTSSLLFPSDIVVNKPRADIIVNAIARAPGGQPCTSWTCGVAIDGGEHRFEHRLRVCGPRNWSPVWRVPKTKLSRMTDAQRDRAFEGWILEDAKETAEVPIRYELAYGGTMTKPPQSVDDAPRREAFEFNPIGCGWIDANHSPREDAIPAPQIEAVDAPRLAPMQHAVPAGFGPISPSWLPRRPLGGTFDENWQKHVWPRWPADYNFAYNNSANPRMIYPGYLRGDESLVLTGVNEADSLTVALPGHRISLGIDGPSPAVLDAHLDTLVADVADPDHAEHVFYLTWRRAFPLENIDAIIIMKHDVDQVVRIKTGTRSNG